MTCDDIKVQSDIQAVDLIELLSPPGSEGIYDFSISESLLLEEAEIQPQEPEQSDDDKAFSAMKSALNTGLKNSDETTTRIIKVENDSLKRISDEIISCENCELFKVRKNTVPGVGKSDAKLMLIGEAPGADEDETGIPFVGKAGKHLDKILAAAGFKREELFICNILKCRPPNNRNPHIKEMRACTSFLKRQIALINPKLIACLGNVSIKFIISPQAPGITRIHGQWFDSVFKIPAMAMYHPSYLIRSESRAKGSPNWQMWQDIQALKKRYDSID